MDRIGNQMVVCCRGFACTFLTMSRAQWPTHKEMDRFVETMNFMAGPVPFLRCWADDDRRSFPVIFPVAKGSWWLTTASGEVASCTHPDGWEKPESPRGAASSLASSHFFVYSKVFYGFLGSWSDDGTVGGFDDSGLDFSKSWLVGWRSDNNNHLDFFLKFNSLQCNSRSFENCFYRNTADQSKHGMSSQKLSWALLGWEMGISRAVQVEWVKYNHWPVFQLLFFSPIWRKSFSESVPTSFDFLSKWWKVMTSMTFLRTVVRPTQENPSIFPSEMEPANSVNKRWQMEIFGFTSWMAEFTSSCSHHSLVSFRRVGRESFGQWTNMWDWGGICWTVMVATVWAHGWRGRVPE